MKRTRARVLIYSHDSFGLGHLRRCQTIAHSLVGHFDELSVLILSGSPIIGSFDFRGRVDFVRIPGVIKLRNGEYTALSLQMDIEETVRLRSSIIRHTAEAFEPDLFLVDKEPLGLRGEVLETLGDLKGRGVPLVLGLRDVMDAPETLATEWERKNVMPALEKLYDDIWVYGTPEMCDPMEGLTLPAGARSKVRFTGYLRRAAGEPVQQTIALPFQDEPFLLVTAGGGGDGEELVDWVISAYEVDRTLPYPALVVFGPFMQPERQADFWQRIDRLPRMAALTFDARFEAVVAKAAGVVAMGGYNTFCEIMSFDKRSLLVPRTVPRLEQTIRASRAAELGLVRMLPDDGAREPQKMIEALRALPALAQPSRSPAYEGLMDGLEKVRQFTGSWLETRGKLLRPVEGGPPQAGLEDKLRSPDWRRTG